MAKVIIEIEDAGGTNITVRTRTEPPMESITEETVTPALYLAAKALDVLRKETAEPAETVISADAPPTDANHD